MITEAWPMGRVNGFELDCLETGRYRHRDKLANAQSRPSNTSGRPSPIIMARGCRYQTWENTLHSACEHQKASL